MGFFTGTPDPARRRAQDAAIVDFWTWWTRDARERAAAAFDSQQVEQITTVGDEISARLEALDPGLAFSTGPGGTARHVLMVSANGDAGRRQLADRWLAAAPAADEAFEYDSWRRPVPQAAGLRMRLSDDGPEVDADSLRVATRTGPQRTDVAVWHPVLAEAPLDQRQRVSFLLLEMLLGERVLDQEVGRIDCPVQEPSDTIAAVDLPDRLRAVAASR